MKTAIACVVMAAATLSAAADLTGRWSGTAQLKMPNGETDNTPLTLTVKQSSGEVTGTIGPGDDQQWPLLNAKIEGDALSFEVQSNGPLFQVKLALVDGRLKGEAKGQGHDGLVTASLDLGRKAD